MANKLQIVINDIAPDIPNTGHYTAITQDTPVNNSSVSPLPVIFLSLAVILGLTVLILKRRKHRKMHLDFDGKEVDLERNFNKKVYLGLISFTSIFAFVGFSLFLQYLTNNALAEEDILTVNSDDIIINIDRKIGTDTSSWTVVEPVAISVKEATPHGYDLYAYAPNGINRLVPQKDFISVSDLDGAKDDASSSDSEEKNKTSASIKPVSEDDATNVWGINLSDLDYIFALPTSKQEALLIDTISEETEENQASTFDVQAIINLDLPAGVYVGEIEYFAMPKQVLSLNSTQATVEGSESAIVTYGSPEISGITNPIRLYDVSFLENSTGATISSIDDIKYAYNFSGWFTQESAGTKVVDADGGLVASTSYTDNDSNWIGTEDLTLYAQWSNSSITLPTITKTGHTCGWNTNGSSSEIEYSSGDTNFHPTADTVLLAVCNPNNYSITIKTSKGIESVSLNGNSCNSASGCNVSVTYGQSYSLIATVKNGYEFSSWSVEGEGSIADSSAKNTNYTVGADSSAITATATPNDYTISLNNTAATTAGSTSATVTYDSNTITSINNPRRDYVVSFSASGNNSSDATISSLDDITYSYIFNGWFEAETSGDKVINATGTLLANTNYTDGSSNWVSASDETLYAQWSNGSITLPVISKPDYNCGWVTDKNATSIEYASEATNFHPTSDITLYGKCILNYVLIYDANGGSGAPDTQTIENVNPGSTQTFDLSPDIPTRSGYGFWGWGESSDSVNPIRDNQNKSLKTNQPVNKLYAIWKPVSGTLQSWSGCSSLAITTEQSDNTIYLLDNRDGQAYKVGRYYMDTSRNASNTKCWMSNLNLGAWSTTDLTSSNSNLESSISASTFDSWRANRETGTSSDSKAIFSPIDRDESSLDQPRIPYDSYGNKYGSLYNYCAATANTYCSAEESYIDASHDLCPANWRLPTGGPSGEYQNLLNGYGGELAATTRLDGTTTPTGTAMSTLLQEKLGFSLAGYFYTSSYQVGVWGAEGRYATSSYSNYVQSPKGFLMHSLTFSSNSVIESTQSDYRAYGLSVRCILK